MAVGTLSLKGDHAVFVPKDQKALQKDTSGYARFWNQQHVAVLQFHPTRDKRWRGEEVQKRYGYVKTAETALRDFRKKRGLTMQVRSPLLKSEM